mgnify:CR=1 FL=1
MKKQAFNPYLPSWEYIPDGEPYVFGDRVYVYGSHDFYNGAVFCMGCDLIARTLFAPTELNISTVTSVFGAPVVIGMMLKRHKEK